MFLISRREINSFEQHFIVLGSVGNVYTVIINSKPQCSCPDFQKGNSCKHIVNLFYKMKRKKKVICIFKSFKITT